MKAVVFHDVGDIRLEEVPDPHIQEPTDAIVRLTASAICGTDLHFIRGTFSGMQEGTILGHEGVGIVEELGSDVLNLKVGDRVLIPSTIACGTCSYCRAGYHAQCDNANPHGKSAGTAFFGGPEGSGPFDGLQAEKARIPFAHVGLVKLPDEVSDDEAILISDIFPTGYFGAELAEVSPGDTVAVFGCGPVGQFAIASAKLKGAGRVIAVDHLEDRLEMARAQGAEVVDFSKENPVERIKILTDDIGVDRVIDAVGVDAQSEERHHEPDNPAEREFLGQAKGKGAAHDGNWEPGNAPGQAIEWAVEALAKAGTLGVIGVYPPEAEFFPLGRAMNKNLTIKLGNCNHRRYIPDLIELVRSGRIKPTEILTRSEPLTDVIEAYKAFDKREPGWIKVALH
jgi:threonine dehydrogenase-like Zn-dependent dehydrogenase